MEKMYAGQRWLSDSEPELGLGIVVGCNNGIVEMFFPATEQQRQYAADGAPLRRVVFAVGDEIETYDGESHVVTAVSEDEGVISYISANRTIEETELSDRMVPNQPLDRMLAGIVDNDYTFRLRREALSRRSAIKGSPIRGYIGCRTDLIPHQLSIVSDVAKRLRPRVLLADEVGLGKTIEACMIMHRLHLTGRADRVLVLLPEPLMHQWFVELLRRFNMLFSLFDEGRCTAIEQHQDVNPFLDSQWVIASIDFLINNPHRAEQVKQAGWDMLIVDEAHHLAWSETEVSPEYALVEALAEKTEAVLLLTATPHQLGPEGHFARLKLLDPIRFCALDFYLEDAEYYEEVADLVRRLREGEIPTEQDITSHEATSQRVREGLEALRRGEENVRQHVIEDLLDSFGPGRVMFRNTREHLTGFPERIAHLTALESKQQILDWLESLLSQLGDEKILLIAKTREQIEHLAEALQQRVHVKLALFHEELTLLQRDRNAAYFSEPDGARLLLCSEIGSEGRNFQFAHHMVMVDLPQDPELLEQRIGRLDRIGQSGEIHIHVPYVKQTEHEVLARWYSEGLNAFEHNLSGATQIYLACKDKLEKLTATFSEPALQELIRFSQEQAASVRKQLMSGQNQLLAYQSFREDTANALIKAITEADENLQFERFAVRLLDFLGVSVEDISERSYVLNVGDLVTELGGDIPDEGLPITFDRSHALSREDMQFMSQDHPMLRNALDVFLSSESGNSSFGVWKRGGEKSILLECCFVLEVVAPQELGTQRFLPDCPIRVVVNHQLRDLSDDNALIKARLKEGNLMKILGTPSVKQELLPKMLAQCEKLAESRSAGIIHTAQKAMLQDLGDELKRLQDLAVINPLVDYEDIDAMKDHIRAVHAALKQARTRLDSIRLIWQE